MKEKVELGGILHVQNDMFPRYGHNLEVYNNSRVLEPLAGPYCHQSIVCRNSSFEFEDKLFQEGESDTN
ncbi:hypothetical protein CR513_23138, partial [Mucuna pruriens]